MPPPSPLKARQQWTSVTLSSEKLADVDVRVDP